MGNELNLKLIVESILKDKGLIDSKAKIEDLEKQVARLRGQTEGFSLSMEGIGKIALKLAGAFGIAFGAGEIASFLKEETLQARAMERQFAAIGGTVEAMGGDASKQVPRVRAFLAALQESTGVADEEAAPAFRKLLGLTQSIGAAMSATKTATVLARFAGTDFATAADLLANVLAGKAGPALKEMGINAKTLGIEGEDTEQALKLLFDRLDKFEESAGGKVDAIDKMRGAWKQLGQTVGEALAPLVEGFAKHEATGLELVKALALAVAGDVEAGAEKARDKLLDLVLEEHGIYVDADTGRKKLLDAAAERDAKARAKRLEEERKAQSAALKQEADQLEKALTDELRARRDAAEQGSDERLDLEMQLIDREATVAVAAEGMTGDAAVKIYEAAETRKLALAKDYAQKRIDALADQWTKDREQFIADARELQNMIDSIESRTAQIIASTRGSGKTFAQQQAEDRARLKLKHDQEMTAARRLGADLSALRKAQNDEDVAFEQKQAEDRSNLQKQMTTDSLNTLASRFAFFKPFAIANAIINTYTAAAEALAAPPGPPWSLIYVAAAIASGLSQVQQIRNTEPGLAHGGMTLGPTRALIGEDGREVVIPLEKDSTIATMAKVFGRAMSAGSGSASIAQPTPPVVHETHNYNLHTMVASERDWRRFERKRQDVARRDRERFAR